MKYFCLLLFSILLFSSCKKDKLLTDSNAKLQFSRDSVLFDTVFTKVGSTTKLFRIYNNHSQPITISKIHLANGSSSPFRINIDGTSGTVMTDIEILANDSLYAFVQVTVDPTHQNNPLLITDEIIFETNGNVQSVYLTAIGQDVYLHKPDHFPTNGLPPYSIISCNGTRGAVWKNDKPHLIFGFAVVDSNCTLLMLPGTKVYLHKNAVLWVYRGGSLQVLGAHNSEVTFEGDRLEPEYKEIPGQWGYIWLMRGSIDNKIDWAKIKNGIIGIKVGDNSPYSQPFVIISNTIIKNEKAAALYTVNAHVFSYNCVYANSGQYVAALTFGGKYHFRHCTFANYWDSNPNNATGSATTTPRSTPAVAFNDSYQDPNTGNITATSLDSALFENCIITGDITEELAFDKTPSNPIFSYYFDHCLIKTTAIDVSDVSHYLNILQNSNPDFKDVNKNDYNLNLTSPAKDAGNSSPLLFVPYDLNANQRNFGAPDLGAYEIQQ